MRGWLCFRMFVMSCNWNVSSSSGCDANSTYKLSATLRGKKRKDRKLPRRKSRPFMFYQFLRSPLCKKDPFTSTDESEGPEGPGPSVVRHPCRSVPETLRGSDSHCSDFEFKSVKTKNTNKTKNSNETKSMKKHDTDNQVDCSDSDFKTTSRVNVYSAKRRKVGVQVVKKRKRLVFSSSDSNDSSFSNSCCSSSDTSGSESDSMSECSPRPSTLGDSNRGCVYPVDA